MQNQQNNNRIYIGVDPGLTGGLVCVDALGHYLFHIQYPLVKEGSRVRKIKGKSHKQDILGIDCIALKELLLFHLSRPIVKGYDSVSITMEKVWLMKDQGISTGSTFMDNFGRLKGVLYCILGHINLVISKTWQKEFFGLTPYLKSMGQKFTRENLGGYEVMLPYGCKVIPDGLSDAYCMAEYGRRTYGD